MTYRQNIGLRCAIKKKFKKFNVTDIVRVCEKTYTSEVFENEGINVHVES